MSEFKKLLESSDLLDDSTKQVLKEEFDSAVEAKVVEMKAEHETQLDESRKEMSELIPQLVEEAVADELESIAEELNEARSLEVTYADRLEQFKESYDSKAKELIDVLVAEAVAEEFEELKEDIDLAKKHQFALAIVESFGDTYRRMFGESDFDSFAEMDEMKAKLESYERNDKIKELTEGLTGRKLRVAEAVLDGVPVERMEAKMESVRGFLTESVSEEEESKTTINESEEAQSEEADKGTVVLENEEPADEKPSVVQESKKRDLVSRSLSRL